MFWVQRHIKKNRNLDICTWFSNHIDNLCYFHVQDQWEREISWDIPLCLPEETGPLYDSSAEADAFSEGEELWRDQTTGPSVYTDCSIDTNEGCSSLEECSLVLEEDAIGYICKCKEGYRRDSNTRECVISESKPQHYSNRLIFKEQYTVVPLLKDTL